MLKKILYFLWTFVFLSIVIISIESGSFLSFIKSMENTTFDIRQKIMINSGVRKHNKDIVIIAVDDASYEYILDKYGEWPMPRDIYAKVVESIQKQKPKSIVFDTMFVKSIKSSTYSDEALINVFKKYKNVYTSMNFDNQPYDLRLPPSLPDSLTVTPYPNTEPYEYKNCRTILEGILNSTNNIGFINVVRSDDGVLRQVPLYLKYQNKYYPQLAYKLVLDYMKESGQVLNIKPNDNGSITLNWYGPSGTFTTISLYKILKAIEKNEDYNFDFGGKTVYFGATAANLFDIKTVPIDKVYPGVEVQATYVNNLLDGSAIKKVSPALTLTIGLFFALLSILFVFKISSMPIASGMTFTIYAIYVMISYFLMQTKSIWMELIVPMLLTLFAFIIAVIIKYLIKSRDFDQQYKLATTDGLTELYNHRYFQEQLANFVSHAKRYKLPLSLIIIDIDFFKKFNDTYGHQSGDAVLKQVAFILKRNVRMSDIVCRYGGEEMSIILPSTTYNEAVNIANKLCTLVSEKKCKLSGGRESNVTISLGVSTFGDDGITPSELIESADKRLYNAKENGRNRVN